MTSTIEIFCCYARKDQPLLQSLKTHLISLQRQGLITLWSDTDIDAGTAWEEEIIKHLNTAQIILLLVSPDFMASDYCYSFEMKRAIERHELKEAHVIPIILSPVDWQDAPFGKLQALPKNAKPITSWRRRSEAFFDAAEGIRKVVEEVTPKPSTPSPAIPKPEPAQSPTSVLTQPSTPSPAIPIKPSKPEPTQPPASVLTQPPYTPPSIQNKPRDWLRIVLIAAVALVLLSSVSVGAFLLLGPQAHTPGSNGAPPDNMSFTIKAMDFSFDQPKTIPAGLIDLTFVNNGAQPHQIQLVRINNGNYDEFASALKKNGPVPSTLQLVTGAGGANVIDPGGKQEVILNLTQGEYASICFVSGSDNIPHYMKGMLQQLTVTGSSNTSQTQPQANAVITMKDFAFDVPNKVTAGAVTWKVTNDGPQLHEMDIVKLHSGVTYDQFKKILFSPNPPLGWIKLNLQPANYVALCFVPDVKTGKPHFMLGMISSFTAA